ncbi:VOC family protein [Oceanobacillus sp. CFH 90083]|uniref:VOC family protein n=1 Tax=Oceanobacillus sp. CFH 90083 TaxID=2592336 RepID=UPI00128B06E6|nr:VOC family protein [Oceanobacillus sp. CFH 90083]
MFRDSQAMSSFPVDDIEKARLFYEETLGIQTTEEAIGFTLHFTETKVFIYSKGKKHRPADYFVLSITVPDIEQTDAKLKQKGISLEIIEGMEHDEYGIIRGKAMNRGPDVSLFKDPAGNLLAIEEN